MRQESPGKLRAGCEAMKASEFQLDPARLWPGEAPWDAPLAIVDLDSPGEAPEEPLMPACPVLGLGNPDHPFAASCDVLVESPATLDGLVRNIVTHPRAAAVIVQLLRMLPGLPPAMALDAESLAYATLQAGGEHLDWLAAQPAAVQHPAGAVRLDRHDAALDIVLDRPDAGNAIDRGMRDGLHDALMLAAADPSIEQVRLRATGRTFSLGADLAEFGTTRDPALAHAIRRLTLPSRAAALCAGKLEVHVQGGCVGAGLEIAAWAARLVATPDAWFHLPELGMGILPGAGGCVSLSRRIGRQRAALMVLSGRRISARKALEWGLVDALVDDPASGEDQPDIG